MIFSLKPQDKPLLLKQAQKYITLGLMVVGKYELKEKVNHLPVQFYILQQDTVKVCCCIDGSDFAIILGKIPNIEEFNLFANIMNINSIMSPYRENTPLKQIALHEMQANIITLNKSIHKKCAYLKVETDVKIKDIIKLQWDVFETQSERDAYYALLCTMKNYGFLDVFGIYSNETLLSVMCVQKLQYLSQLYIFAVFTRKNERHKGYIKTLLDFFSKTTCNKSVYLLCEQQLVSFYKQYTFTEQKIYNQRKIIT